MKDYTTVVDGRKRIIRSPEISTDDRFEATYKGFTILIRKDKYGYYVFTANPELSFGTIYDGWYNEDDHANRCMKAGIPITPFTIEGAIQDAIRNILL